MLVWRGGTSDLRLSVRCNQIYLIRCFFIDIFLLRKWVTTSVVSVFSVEHVTIQLLGHIKHVSSSQASLGNGPFTTDIDEDWSVWFKVIVIWEIPLKRVIKILKWSIFLNFHVCNTKTLSFLTFNSWILALIQFQKAYHLPRPLLIRVKVVQFLFDIVHVDIIPKNWHWWWRFFVQFLEDLAKRRKLAIYLYEVNS